MADNNNSSKEVHDIWGADNDTDVVPPFCYECLETDTKSTAFFLLACSKIVCEQCRIRLVNSDGLVKCSTHNVYEKCIKIDNKLPGRLKGLFRNDDDEQLRKAMFHIEYIDKLHNDLSVRLQQLPPEPTDQEMELIDAKQDALDATGRALEAELDDELTKLSRDLKAGQKMEEYFANYTKMMTQKAKSSGSDDTRFRAPMNNNNNNNNNSKMSVCSSIKSTSDDRRTRDDSGYGINHRSDANSSQYSEIFRKAIDQIRPTPCSTAANNKTMPIPNRYGRIGPYAHKATNKTMPLKSILKNSGSRQTTTNTPSTSRGSSEGQHMVSIPNVRPQQPNKVYQQVQRIHPQPDFFQNRSNLNADVDQSNTADVQHPRQCNANQVDRFLGPLDFTSRINQLPKPRQYIPTNTTEHNTPLRSGPTTSTHSRHGTPLSGVSTAVSMRPLTHNSLFRKAIESSRATNASATNKTMPLKSILKNSGSRQNTTNTPSTSRGTSGGQQVVSIPKVRPQQPNKVYQQVQRTHPQPDFFRSRSNLNADDDQSNTADVQHPRQSNANQVERFLGPLDFTSRINQFRSGPTSTHSRHGTPHPRRDDISGRINQLPQPRQNISTGSNGPPSIHSRLGTPHPRRDAH